jgi:TRAP-type transport system small permease protein
LSELVRRFDRLLFFIIAGLLGAMVADVSMQILFRYLVRDAPTWTEELARFLFTWQIFLAAAVGFGRGSHIVVDILVAAVPESLRRWMLISSSILVLAFLVVLGWQGTNMVSMTSNMKSSAMELNMGVVYASLPVSAVISAVYVLLRLIDTVRGVDSFSEIPGTN